jgi:micrococcal nuclease
MSSRICAITAARLLACAASGHGAAALRVVVGDTFDLGTERIRVMGVDAPELHGAACASEYRRAVQARDRLADLLADGPAIARHGLDRYGRTLAVVTVDGVDVADVLIGGDHGLARPIPAQRVERAPFGARIRRRGKRPGRAVGRRP